MFDPGKTSPQSGKAFIYKLLTMLILCSVMVGLAAPAALAQGSISPAMQILGLEPPEEPRETVQIESEGAAQIQAATEPTNSA